MRNILIILLLLLFWSCTSCNSDSPKDDSDINDKDSFIEQDLDILTDTDSIDSDTEKDDETDAEQADSDADYQEAEECPQLKYANFPYYNSDGSIHFCRKCDTPTADDPQCVKNLWKEMNQKYYEKYPDLDCLDYPCVVKGLRAVLKGETSYTLTDCDKFLTPRNSEVWSGGREDWRHHFFDKGKVAFDMSTSISSTSQVYTYPTDKRVFSYDPEKDEYTVIMPNTTNTLAYYNGKYVAMSFNANKINDEASSDKYKNMAFITMYEEGKGYRVIYPGTVEFIPYSSITMSDEWFFMVFQEKKGSPYKIKYSKVGEWKWTEMEYEQINVPNMSGNRVAFYTNEGKGYICDLSKYPKKVSDCTLINRNGEYVYNPVMNKSDGNRFAYTTADFTEQTMKMTMVKIEGEEYKYTDYSFPCDSKDEVVGYGVDQFKGEMIVHAEIYKLDQNTRSSQLCYFNIETHENICQGWSDQGISDFEGSRYLLYHTFKSTGLILRDMECYCKLEPEACPFDEYLPEEIGDEDIIPDNDALVYIEPISKLLNI